jgi:hypothetical protein
MRISPAGGFQQGSVPPQQRHQLLEPHVLGDVGEQNRIERLPSVVLAALGLLGRKGFEPRERAYSIAKRLSSKPTAFPCRCIRFRPMPHPIWNTSPGWILLRFPAVGRLHMLQPLPPSRLQPDQAADAVDRPIAPALGAGRRLVGVADDEPSLGDVSPRLEGGALATSDRRLLWLVRLGDEPQPRALSRGVASREFLATASTSSASAPSRRS